MTKVTIDRDLLEQVAAELEDDNDRYMLGRELRAILAQPAQQGEAVEVVAVEVEAKRITVVSITGSIQAVAAADYDSLKAERDRLQEELADLHNASSAPTEKVEVVGYAGFHQLELRRLLPQYPGMKVKKEPGERYTEPLMTVAQHERILAASVPAGCKVLPVKLLKRLAGNNCDPDCCIAYWRDELRALLASAEGGRSDRDSHDHTPSA